MFIKRVTVNTHIFLFWPSTNFKEKIIDSDMREGTIKTESRHTIQWQNKINKADKIKANITQKAQD